MGMEKTIGEMLCLKAEMERRIADATTEAVAEFERETGLTVADVRVGFQSVCFTDGGREYEKRACVKICINLDN